MDYTFLIIDVVLIFYLIFVYLRERRLYKKLELSNAYHEFKQKALDEHAIVSITDVKGTITYANDRFSQISGYSNAELVGQNHRILRSPKHDAEFFKQLWKTIANGKVWNGVIVNHSKDGKEYWVEATIVPHLDATGKSFEYIAISTDITQQILAEKKVQSLALLPEENPEPILRVNFDGTLLYANSASHNLLKEWDVSVGESMPAEWIRVFVKVLDTEVSESIEFHVGNKTFLLTLGPLKELNYVNIYARDITEHKKAEANLSFQATHDQLTGLKNRFYFEQYVTDALEEIHQNDSTAVLIYLDLDQFKVVNDTSGHVAGDELLRQLGGILSEVVRESDMLSRLGGDEFGMFLKNCDLDKGLLIAGKIHEVINEYRFVWEEKMFQVGSSIGVVLVDDNSNSLIDVLGAADVACYEAKDAGRNVIKVYKSDDEGTTRRKDEMHWATEIPSALAENRFILMGQSITPLQDDDEHHHYEVLLRMIGRDGNSIPPGAFIPSAERYNLMSLIDHWVVENTFSFIHELKLAGKLIEGVSFAINLSGESMARESFLTLVRRLIVEYEVPPGAVSFEVTETAAISNLSDAVEFIKELKLLGCKFALDDFGSGLSSFAYLKNLPVDFLKIDGVFVRDMMKDPIDRAMVRSINQIGHVMGIKTIAEFVEDDAVKETLRDIGVDFAQGYGIDKPKPLTDIFDMNTK